MKFFRCFCFLFNAFKTDLVKMKVLGADKGGQSPPDKRSGDSR